MKQKFTKYTLTQRYGMEGIGDMELEWLTPQEKEQRWKDYKNYQEKCKQDGIYTQIIEMQQDPLFCKSSTPTESYSFQIIDFSDGKK
jgi:hypothetical protein